MMGFWDAVASAGPYPNNLHLAPGRQPHQHLITQFLQARCSLTPNQQCQSTKGNIIVNPDIEISDVFVHTVNSTLILFMCCEQRLSVMEDLESAVDQGCLLITFLCCRQSIIFSVYVNRSHWCSYNFTYRSSGLFLKIQILQLSRF